MSKKITRVIRLLDLFHRRGRLAKRDMMDVLQADKKTVSRDLEALLDASIPIFSEGTGRHQVWCLDQEYRKQGVVAGPGDMAALYLGRQMLGFLKGTPLSQWLEDLQDRLDGQSRDEKRVREQRIVLREEPGRHLEDHEDTVDTILDCVLRTRKLRLRYPSKFSEELLEVWPLTLMAYRRALYLIGWLPERQLHWTFAVDRIKEAEGLKAKFHYPHSYSVHSYLGGTFGIWKSKEPPAQVRVRFEASKAHLVLAREWYQDQTIETLDNGDVLLTFFASGVELVRWVLEWGDKAEVLDPPWLREKVEAELVGALAKYRVSERERASRLSGEAP